ncbi:MAG: Gfo/Idh/MocA family oxidoreductase [Caldilineaceae bacterium]|nr:Gfo/Idh/MocA family oxidoreductase [Caldilineaceae bacterium]
MSTVNIALVGVGGFGQFYLRALSERGAMEQVALVGVVDPTIANTEFAAALTAADIPMYANLDALFAAEKVDLTAIAAPTHYHRYYATAALAHGSHVLCEKPLCATIQEAEEMVAAQAAADRFLAVGYQWSYSAAIQSLKRDIIAGVLGRPKRCKAIVLWPRTASYYGRNNWAGRMRSVDGRWVLDSPVSNATAHYLHNLFFLLGETQQTSAELAEIQAELYRANPIPNCDTAALRVMTKQGVEVLYYTSHAIPAIAGPSFSLEFDEATVTYHTDGGGQSVQGPIVARAKSGTEKIYGDPFADQSEKIWQCADAVRSGAAVACDIKAAIPHVYAVNGMHESMPTVQTLPKELYHQDGELTWVEGLQEALQRCYAQNVLPSEQGDLPWSRAGRVVDLGDYESFPQNATLITMLYRSAAQ